MSMVSKMIGETKRQKVAKATQLFSQAKHCLKMGNKEMAVGYIKLVNPNDLNCFDIFDYEDVKTKIMKLQ